MVSNNNKEWTIPHSPPQANSIVQQQLWTNECKNEVQGCGNSLENRALLFYDPTWQKVCNAYYKSSLQQRFQ